MNLKPMLNMVEEIVVKEINAKQDLAVDKALEIIKAKIPGQIDDMLIEQLASEIKDQLKQLSLELADKIDGEVG